MKNIKNILLLLVTLAVGVGAVWFFFGRGEEAKIRQRFLDAVGIVNKQAEEKNHTLAAKTLQFGYLFGDEVTVNIHNFPYNGTNDISEFTSLVFRGRTMCKSIDLTILGLEVEINGDTAIARCHARAKVDALGTTYDEKHHFHASLKKVGRKWIFLSFEDDDVIKK